MPKDTAEFIDLLKPEPVSGPSAGNLWNDTLNRAIRFRRKHWNGEQAWQRYVSLYKGDHWNGNAEPLQEAISSDDPRNKITVNLTGSTVLNILPFLIRQRPIFRAKPTRPDFVVSAALQQEALNYNWRVRNMQPQLKRAALDSIVIGHGIIKTGFQLEVFDDEQVANRARRKGSIEYRDYIKKEEPFIHRVDPFMFIWDPEAQENDLNSARWCAEVFFKPIRDVIENKRYNQRVRSMIRDGAVSPETVTSFLKIGGDDGDTFGWEDDVRKDLTRIVLFELWDKRSGKYFVFAKGVDQPLIEEDEWPYPYLQEEGMFPYEMLPFIPLINEPYPLGMPAFMEDQQHELNRTRTAMFAARRRMARKYQVIEGQIDGEELTALRTGEDGAIVVVKERNAVTPIEHSPIPPDVYNVEATIKQDIRELTGSDELIRGGQLPSRTTATEVQTRTQLLGLKLEDRVESVDMFVENIGRKLIMHMKANYLTDQMVKVSGAKGEHWVQFTPEDIQGEFDLEIESTSKEQVDPVLERSQALQILQMIMDALPVLQQSGVVVNFGELFKWVFSHFDTQEVQRFFPDAGIVSPPIEQQLAQGQPTQPSGGSNIGATPPAGPTFPQVPPDQQRVLGAEEFAGAQAGQGLGALLGGSSGLS